MKQLTAMTQDAVQKFSFSLDDGSVVNVDALIFVPSQNGWFYSLSYQNFIVLNQLMVNSPNMLRKYRNIIPFGICCTVQDGYEVINQSDFVSGRVKLYQLNAQDVIDTEILITETLPVFAGYPLL